jgi:hypothetical protein
MREKLIQAMRVNVFHAIPREEAEAAINAILDTLREPDRPMLQAMMASLGTEDHRPLGPMWRAAIDVAKNGS